MYKQSLQTIINALHSDPEGLVSEIDTQLRVYQESQGQAATGLTNDQIKEFYGIVSKLNQKTGNNQIRKWGETD